jgi:hypothetical protein
MNYAQVPHTAHNFIVSQQCSGKRHGPSRDYHNSVVMTVLRCISGFALVSSAAEVSGATSHGESWFRLGTEPEVCLLDAVALLAWADSCKTDTHCYNSLGTLTRGPGGLLPSDLAPILQYVSTPPSDFLAKILGVDTSPFVWNTRFYFTHSYL